MNTSIVWSKVEQCFHNKSILHPYGNIPYVTVNNLPQLGMLTALRFLEWVVQNPDGVISLPTGKTPEYFIRWTNYLLENWDSKKVNDIRYNFCLKDTKPILRNLRFVQIDEFYPIHSFQHNSFNYYVRKFYVEGFGLDYSRGLYINCDEIPLSGGRPSSEIFPSARVDLSLRYREPNNSFEQMQQESIFAIDNWCSIYEERIRSLGGIGFFLGGIGPDGHIAFNTRGSDPYSCTRLTSTNFETQAVAANDLGGMEVSRNRLVITIGLETITYNSDCVAIIFAAGEAKANVVRDALEENPSNLFPATALTKLPNARFYLTHGAASLIKDEVINYYTSTPWNQEKTDRAVIDLCRKLDKFGHHLQLSDLQNDEFCRLIPNLDDSTVQNVVDSILKKLDSGMLAHSNQVYYHTGPHHDDIMLGMLPHIHRLLRNETNKAVFSILTSGFTAVTNKFILEALESTLSFLDNGLIQMVEYPDFFEIGYRLKRDKDIYHYLIKVASDEPFERKRGLAHRIVRCIVEIWEIEGKADLRTKIVALLEDLQHSYDGEKNPPKIQVLKGMIREFEEELVWAYFGITAQNIHHLRLGFYTGDIFTEKPKLERDVEPILKQLIEINPTVISLAFDPEGSGPDTHYKVLQAIAEAVRLWREKNDLSALRIWGYRNVWYRFHPAEATHIVPVSLNAMGVMDEAFRNSYLSQVEASFPSYQHDGTFSDLARKIWVDQLKSIQLLLGKDYFYQHESPRVRATHGLLYFKEMNVDEFLQHARELAKSVEGEIG